MEAQITAVKENPLLDRREVQVQVDHEGEGTPSEEDVKSRVAAENGLDEDEVEVDSIYTGFGKNNSRAYLKVFEEFEYDEELQEETIDEEVEVTEELKDAVSGTITEAKDTLQAMEEVDWKAAIEAEKDNKNRTTLIDWLESR
jgi:small subunit ribosomal protein S24e